MHPFFDPLNDRETMLLLTAATVGGSEETAVFDYLPAKSRERVLAKAQALASIPKDKRVQFVVHVMKDELRGRGTSGVDKIDASWLLQGLKGESPRIVAAILVGMPTSVIRAVVARLPQGIRKRLPPKESLRAVNAEILCSLRQLFAARFCTMPEPPRRGFGFRDLIQLDPSELSKLVRDLGLIELGQAFASVGKMALSELCRRLPRESAEELVAAVRSASRIDLPDIKKAQRFLSRIVVNFSDTEEFFRKAGLWRLAKACAREDEGFCQAFAQRLPREIGLLFLELLGKARELEEEDEEAARRLQDSVLCRLGVLAERAEISRQWSELELVLHDPAVLQPPQ